MTTPVSSQRRADDFTQRVEVETPELVVLSYTIAGIGSRVYAGFLDLLVCIGLFLGLGLTALLLQSNLGMAGIGSSGAWAIAFISLTAFGVFWGYHVVCESFFDGQSIGKRHLGLRVVRDGGYSVGFASSAIRNIMRAIDMQPGVFYLFGITSAVLSKSGKRLGDIVAGTVVIQEQLVESPLTRAR
ncbi:MAG: RDD family protein, partial [Gemmatimonadaceae bacterium]